jgi:hypothetical protein
MEKILVYPHAYCQRILDPRHFIHLLSLGRLWTSSLWVVETHHVSFWKGSGGVPMGLSQGFYFGLTASQVKALRGTKGDAPRRQFIEVLKRSHDSGWALAVGDAWCFLQHLFEPANYAPMPAGCSLCRGRSLHKGQISRIELLPSDTLPHLVEALKPVDEAGLRALFFEMSEERFRYRWVPFWVAKEWQREGRTTVLTEAQFSHLWRALKKLRAFLASAVQAHRQVVFACNFKDGP